MPDQGLEMALLVALYTDGVCIVRSSGHWGLCKRCMKSCYASLIIRFLLVQFLKGGWSITPIPARTSRSFDAQSLFESLWCFAFLFHSSSSSLGSYKTDSYKAKDSLPILAFSCLYSAFQSYSINAYKPSRSRQFFQIRSNIPLVCRTQQRKMPRLTWPVPLQQHCLLGMKL